jgi:F0F1-type ATP synthase membrane subunit b/b'
MKEELESAKTALEQSDVETKHFEDQLNEARKEVQSKVYI